MESESVLRPMSTEQKRRDEAEGQSPGGKPSQRARQRMDKDETGEEEW